MMIQHTNPVASKMAARATTTGVTTLKKTDITEALAGIAGVVLGLVFLTLIGAPEDVWNHYIEPALMLISVLAFGGFMIFSVLLFNLGRKK